MKCVLNMKLWHSISVRNFFTLRSCQPWNLTKLWLFNLNFLILNGIFINFGLFNSQIFKSNACKSKLQTQGHTAQVHRSFLCFSPFGKRITKIFTTVLVIFISSKIGLWIFFYLIQTLCYVSLFYIFTITQMSIG